jgi:hypothetical protein
LIRGERSFETFLTEILRYNSGMIHFAAAVVTFNKDVQPILQEHCQECHRPGQVAPMSLLTYKDARPWAAALRQAVLTKKMPPWHAADVPHEKFLNDRRLRQVEIDTLVNWAQTGAVEGDVKDAPAPRTFASDWIQRRQVDYQELETPVVLPKGTKILVSAWYDNSTSNAANPDATKDVYWGEQTWEEMLAGFMDFVVPVEMNPARIARPVKPVKAAEVARAQ